MSTKQKPLVDLPLPIPCRLCSMPTLMHGTQLCDRCWELESRIKMDPVIAGKILHELGFAVVRGEKVTRESLIRAARDTEDAEIDLVDFAEELGRRIRQGPPKSQ